MASYLRQTNYEPLRTPLYQPNFELLDKVVEGQQFKYDRGVQSVANTYNRALGLSETLSPYNQTRVNSMMDNATKQLKSVATLDFSKLDNQAKAEGFFAPIFDDDDVRLEHGAQQFGQQQYQSAIAMRDSKDKDQREGYSDTNLAYVMHPLNKLANATTREEMLSAAGEARNRVYVPYQNTVAKLEKQAKDSGLDITVAKQNGAWIITSKFGQDSVASLKDWAASHLDANDIKQLEVNSTVAYESLKDKLSAGGIPVTNEMIADELYKGARDSAYQNREGAQKVYNFVENEVNKLVEKQKQGTLTDDQKDELAQRQAQLEAAKSSLDTSTSRLEDFNKVRGDARTLHDDYMADPIGKMQELAYDRLLGGWANSYGDGHAKEEWKENDVWKDLMGWQNARDINDNTQKHEDWRAELQRQTQLEIANMKDKDKDGKSKETKEDKELTRLNTPIFGGQSPEITSSDVVGSYPKALFIARNQSVAKIGDIEGKLFNLYVTKGAGIKDPSIADRVMMYKGTDKKVSPEDQLAIKDSTLYKNLDLSKMKYSDLYNEFAHDAQKYAQDYINDSSNPYAAEITKLKFDVDVELKNVKAIENMINDPNHPLAKYKKLMGEGGIPKSRDSFVDQRLQESGYQVKKGSSSSSPMGLNWSQDVVTKGGKAISASDYEDLRKTYGKEYDNNIAEGKKQAMLLSKDPEVKRMLFAQNFPVQRYDADDTIAGEKSESVFKQVFNDETLSAGLINIGNADQLAAGVDGANAEKWIKEFKNQANHIEHLETVPYAENGRYPYRFYFKEGAYSDFLATHSKDSDKGAEAQAFVNNIKQHGIQVNYAGPTEADIMRKNSLEKVVNDKGTYSFKADTDGKFGFTINKLGFLDGGPQYEALINYVSAVDPITGQYTMEDGKYVYKDYQSKPMPLEAMTVDEAANAVIPQLLEFRKLYANDQASGK